MSTTAMNALDLISRASRTTLGIGRSALVFTAVGCSSTMPESANGQPPMSIEAPAPDMTSANQEASGKREIVCGQEPLSYEALAGANRALVACSRDVQPKIHLFYLREAGQPFPMGFGLEETVRKECLSPDGLLHASFREAGVCSNIAMAMIVLRCVREQTEERCSLPEALRSYYSSSADSEWHSLEGDALPPGATTDRHGQRIAEEYKPIADFLSYLADHVEQGPYDPKRTEQMDPEQVSPHLSPRGIRIADVNWSGPLVASMARIESELKARGGLTFVALTQLGWVYGAAAPQMSHLEFLPTEAGVLVAIPWRRYDPHHYELFFERHDGNYRLVELRQLMQSDL